MDYMISKFSHEIRNPLTSLNSSIQLIESQHPEVRDFKYWTSINSAIRYIRDLLDDFSHFTKSESLNCDSFSLRTLIEEVSLSFAATIANSDVEYTSKIDPAITNMIGDKTKLQEVLRNLLKNAFDAASPDKTIYLDASKKGSEVVLTIKDTGCGMSKEQLQNIFEPFVTYKKDGTGLGLAICKNIIDAHGGCISVKSTLNKGTTFQITLPLNTSSL